MHAVLLSAAVILAVTLARGIRRTAAAAARAAAAAELEQALLAEAHHRIKNSLPARIRDRMEAVPIGKSKCPGPPWWAVWR